MTNISITPVFGPVVGTVSGGGISNCTLVPGSAAATPKTMDIDTITAKIIKANATRAAMRTLKLDFLEIAK